MRLAASKLRNVETEAVARHVASSSGRSSTKMSRT
eukprot:CAMPEP_0172748608 /NCGR_PEP_ID=MMETSP1074-20121228/145409_1 /TAXON_ID=2916 /ORGANISM="Ceratium fusus, Strain PA161109" /LENGTH=34 /DNA_ID= /DNA_START= /DNA_END= /DNA_ORIENTATION=